MTTLAKRERVFLTAEQWQKRIVEHQKEQRDHDKKVRYELSLDDLRSECIAIIHNEFGSDAAAYERVHERGGATVQTLKRYATAPHWTPKLQTVQASLRAVGWELGPRKRMK